MPRKRSSKQSGYRTSAPANRQVARSASTRRIRSSSEEVKRITSKSPRLTDLVTWLRGDNVFLDNRPIAPGSARPRVHATVIEAPAVPSRTDQSTRRTSVRLNALPVRLDDLRQATVCASRQTRKEVIFAAGSGGKKKQYPNRKSPSKVRC